MVLAFSLKGVLSFYINRLSCSSFQVGCVLFQEVKKKLETAANNTKSWKDKVAHHEGLIRLIEPGELSTEELQKYVFILCHVLTLSGDLLKSAFSCSLLVSQQPINITLCDSC